MEMDNLSHQLLKFFPEERFTRNTLNHVSEEKLFQSFIEEQYKIQETLKKNKTDPDSDEELKQQLQNAVKQYKSNKKQESFEQSFSTNTPMLLTSNKEGSKENKRKSTSTQPKSNAERQKNLRPIENLLGGSETNIDCEIESNGSAISDVKELINYFFLKKPDEVENIEIKRYKEYEKQGAIPKYFVRENANENSSRGTTKNERLKSKEKLNERYNQNVQSRVSSDHTYSKNKTQLCKTNFSEGSDGSIVKLGEGTCSRPFFYIVPENPSPNFLFPPGCYYVSRKPPDSASGLSIIVHPETASQYKVNVGENFEIKASKSGYTNGSDIRNMNDLGKAVAHKSNSHLNIGPEDVKLNEFFKNLEGNNETRKSYDKTPGSPDERTKDAAVPLKEDGEFETATGRIQEPEDGAWGVTSAAVESELCLSEHSDSLSSLEKVQQALNSGFLATNGDSSTYFEDTEMQSLLASERLKKKIEDQFSRMLAALPESNIQELRDICEVFEGDEEQVNEYIEEVQRKNRTRQHVLDMQYIFPDADPDFLHKKIEDLGDNDAAINNLIVQLLDDREYPKILSSHIDAERQRLWKNYVDNFNVSNYIRNVPNPKNFEVADTVKNEKSVKLDLEFLQSRYPRLDDNFLRSKYNIFNNNLTKTCASLDLQDCEIIRLANSTFKSKDFDEAFLKEVCYIDNKKEIDKYLTELSTIKEVEEEEARLNDTFLYCPLCCNDELITSEAVTCADGDLFCKDCVKRYVFVKLGDGVYKYPCPSDSCENFFTYATLEKLLPDAVLSNIIKKQQAAEISVANVDGLESCPFCEFVYIPNPEDKIFKCQNPSCLIETCRKCHEVNHIPLHCEEIERQQDVEARKKIEESMTEKLVRTCPTCFKKFVKIDGCNRMACVCGTVVCYYCRRKINGYDHFSQNGGKCPLYSQNAQLHTTEVIQAGVEERDRILKENPGIRILYDPTTICNWLLEGSDIPTSTIQESE